MAHETPAAPSGSARSRLLWAGGAVAFVAGVVALMLWLTGAFHPKVGPARGAKSEPTAVMGRAVPPGAAVVPVEERTIPLTELASGTIEAAYRSDVAAKLLAKVIEVRVVAGQKVAKDEPIVLLDDADLQARLGQAEASAAQATAALDQARIEAKRIEEALQGGAANPIEAERARNRVREAEAGLDRAKRGVEEAKTVLAYAVIRSPMTGVIVDKRVQPGDTVTPGQVVASVYDPTRMQLVASVRESLAIGLEVGKPISVQIDALGHQCSGLVSEIVPQSEAGSRSFQVKVTGPCPDGVYAGMFGRLLLPLGEEKVIVIPARAVRRVGQLDLVDVVLGDGARSADTERGSTLRTVRLGRTLGDDVEVLSGLRVGESVVVPAAGATRG